MRRIAESIAGGPEPRHQPWYQPGKLCPKRDPDQVRRDVERLINLKLLGIRDPDQADEHDFPGCLI